MDTRSKFSADTQAALDKIEQLSGKFNNACIAGVSLAGLTFSVSVASLAAAMSGYTAQADELSHGAFILLIPTMFAVGRAFYMYVCRDNQQQNLNAHEAFPLLEKAYAAIADDSPPNRPAAEIFYLDDYRPKNAQPTARTVEPK